MAYIGPGDIVGSAAVFWGMRGYSAAYAAPGTNLAIQIQRSGGGGFTADVTVATTGDLGVTVNATDGNNGVSMAAWAGINTLVLNIMYDQTGGGNNLILSGAAAAVLLNTLKGGTLPALFFSSSGPDFYLGNTPSTSSPLTVCIASQRTSGFSAQKYMANGFGGKGYFGYDSSPNTIFSFVSGTLDVTVPDANFHGIVNVCDTSTVTLNVDHVTASSTQTAISGMTSMWVGVNAGTLNYMDGYIQEVGMWPSAFNSTNQDAMISNQLAYWTVAASSAAPGYLFFGQALSEGLFTGAGVKILDDLLRRDYRDFRRLFSQKDKE